MVGRVEAKLVSLGALRGIVVGNWGEVSEDTHTLLSTLATNRAKVAGGSIGKKGRERSEEGERAVAIGYLRRTLGVAAIKAQCLSLLGRVEGMGPGSAAAAGRRREAANIDRQWRLEQQAYSLSVRQGRVCEARLVMYTYLYHSPTNNTLVGFVHKKEIYTLL